ncbi:hypothetical protein [Nitrososphaera sp.]
MITMMMMVTMMVMVIATNSIDWRKKTDRHGLWHALAGGSRGEEKEGGWT